MRYLKFSEDYSSIILQRTPPDEWRYPLFNKDCCYMFTTGGQDRLVVAHTASLFLISGFDLFLRDEAAGAYWSIVRKSPDVLYEKFHYEYLPSQIIIESEWNGVHARVVLVVPSDGTVVGVSVHLTVKKNLAKKLKIFSIADIIPVVPEADPSDFSLNEAYYSKEAKAVIAYRRKNVSRRSSCVAFLSSSLVVQAYDCSPDKIYGRVRGGLVPVPVRLGKAANSYVSGGPMSAMLVNEIDLIKTVDFSYLFGFSMQSADCAYKEINDYRSSSGTFELLKSVIEKKLIKDNLYYNQNLLVIEHKEFSAYFNCWAKREILFNVFWSRRFFVSQEKWFREMLKSLRGFMRIASAQEVFDNICELFQIGKDCEYFSIADGDRVDATLDFILLLVDFEQLNSSFGVLSKIAQQCSEILHFSAEYLYDLFGQNSASGLLRVGQFAPSQKPFVYESVALSIKLFDVSGKFVSMVENTSGYGEVVLQLIAARDIMELSINSTGFAGDQYFDVISIDDNKSEETITPLSLMPQLMAICAGLVPEERVASLRLKIERRLRTAYGYMSRFPAYQQFSPELPGWSALPPGTWQNGGILIAENIAKFRMDCVLGDTRLALQTLTSLVPLTSYRIVGQERAMGEPYFIAEAAVTLLHPKDEGFAYSGLLGGNAGLLYDVFVENYSILEPLLSAFNKKEELVCL